MLHLPACALDPATITPAITAAAAKNLFMTPVILFVCALARSQIAPNQATSQFQIWPLGGETRRRRHHRCRRAGPPKADPGGPRKPIRSCRSRDTPSSIALAARRSLPSTHLVTDVRRITLVEFPAMVASSLRHQLLTCSQARSTTMPPMEQLRPPQVRCAKCAQPSEPTRTMLDTQTGRTYHMLSCRRCGFQTWSSEVVARETAPTF